MTNIGQCSIIELINRREDKVMSLISCPECGKEVSDKAQSCPNCGCHLHGTQEMNAEMHRAGTAGMPLNQQQSASQVKPKKKRTWMFDRGVNSCFFHDLWHCRRYGF